MSAVLTTRHARENALRDEMVQVGSDLFHRRYTTGSAGNISARLDDGWLITPTDACLGRLDPATLSKADLAGNWVSGDKPSKTLALHRAAYDTNASVGAVVHTHSTHLVALTLSGVWQQDDVLPPITPYYVMKVGHVPLIPYHRPGDPAVAERVRGLANRVRAVLLERLGPVVWGATISQAAWALEELEETAQLWLMTDPKPPALGEAQIAELREVFGATW